MQHLGVDVTLDPRLMTLNLHPNKIDTPSKKLIACYTEREKMIARLSFVPIVLDKLSASQIDLYKEIWYDLVEITNAAQGSLPIP